MAKRDPYHQSHARFAWCRHCSDSDDVRVQIRRARHGAALAIADELDQHASGIETDRFDDADWGPEEDPWQACWGEYTEPVTLPQPFATLADVA